MLDCIIVGSGIAGISAALTLKANGKNFMLLGSPDLSVKISRAECIRNYPGLSSVTGREFARALKKQLAEAEISVTDERVSGVYAMGGKFAVLTQSGVSFESKTVILATGVESVKRLEGEEEFLGRGVSYCATCDGFLYKGKTIGVLSTSKRFEHEVEYLAKLAGKVYLMPMYKDVGDFSENVEKIIKMPLAVKGEKKVNRLVFKDGELPVDGVFLLKESISPAVLVGGLEMSEGHVAVARDMSTNLKGCFAAGDCTGRPYQYAKAAGEGNIAAHSVSAMEA
ncbi:MAG: NAD(P)/FAD-dependent oxidoreductase [Christensenellaceae bacterium]|jgi:tRNA uridine 5-carboxymethylaminomethyl modification enzyme gidA